MARGDGSGNPQVPMKPVASPTILGKGQLQVGRKAGQSLIDAVLGRKSEFAICLDATGSMSRLLSDAKKSIKTIIDRVIEQSGARIKLQIFAYRDYDVGARVLETSPLSSDASELVAWLDKITAQGGGANQGEAIEEAMKQVAAGSFAAVLLAGDEPSNPRAELDAGGRRDVSTAHDWARTLGQRNVPIHTFIVGRDARTIRDFGLLSETSGGKSGYLDGSDEMIDMAVMAILAGMKGTEAVTAYAQGRQLSGNARNFQQLLIAGPGKPSR